MAIDPLRGLPSFAEMYGAYKNKKSLGDMLGEGVVAGVKGWQEGQASAAKSKELEVEMDLKKAQAEEARAKKKDLETPSGTPVELLSTLGFSPEEVNQVRTVYGPMIPEKDRPYIINKLTQKGSEGRLTKTIEEANRRQGTALNAQEEQNLRSEAVRLVDQNPRNIRLVDADRAIAVEEMYQKLKALRKTMGRTPDRIDTDTLVPPTTTDGYEVYPE